MCSIRYPRYHDALNYYQYIEIIDYDNIIIIAVQKKWSEIHEWMKKACYILAREKERVKLFLQI